MNIHHPALGLLLCLTLATQVIAQTVQIPDTGQSACYDESREIPFPHEGQPYHGQDAQYQTAQPSYRDNSDGTVTDLITGLTWTKAVDTKKSTLPQAQAQARQLQTGGHNDWRVPNIKELYSLIDFRGYTGFATSETAVPSNAIPFINTDFFAFAFGNTTQGERYIDAQWLSSTIYVDQGMGGKSTLLFGVNFADGRIKGYGTSMPGPSSNRREKTFYVRFVRGSSYGQNQFIDNQDGTITDQATGLTWTKNDSGTPLSWKDALAYAENLTLAGHNDWRLPNAKELQYILDYSRSPGTTQSPALSPLFDSTPIQNESGKTDYGWYWSSTTHLDGPVPAQKAVYIAFGRAIGQMNGQTMDVHGAGAQRSDPKQGSPGLGHGPQGDAIRIKNFARCVRGGKTQTISSPTPSPTNQYPANVKASAFFPHQTTTSSNTKPPGNSPNQPNSRTAHQTQRPSFINRLDQNKDGKVSRSEFDGPPDAFDRHDSNRDGYLSESEAPQGPPPNMR